jgi:protein gp37
MNKTKIEWCDMTWNPVTGCFHNCPYCYAVKIANRFGLKYTPMLGDPGMEGAGKYDTKEYGENSMLELEKPYYDRHEGIRSSYPMSFMPTFHKYRLKEPTKYKEPQNVFVCSMADLFGDWIPEEWIRQVFKACAKAPQHRYIFLTKNYRRYNELRKKGILPLYTNMYFGASVTNERQLKQACLFWDNIDFLSVEPLTEYIGAGEWFIDGNLKAHWKWVIVGAESGNRKGKIIPKREWIEDIVNECRHTKTPVFLKTSLAKIWGESLIQEYPWETAKNEGSKV